MGELKTRAVLLACALSLLLPKPAAAQLGAMVSPGRLTKAHASLEGVGNCQKCHETGKQVTVEKCLACHRPVADRIRLRKGVHRNATGDCVTCHVEHAGEDAELRPFNTKTFDHAREAGFPLDGRHANVACATCHKTRSFLTAQPACATCHADVHKGQLGRDCARCHALNIGFKETRRLFDHGRTSFPLIGAHVKIDCARCHPNGRFKASASPGGASAGACATCHQTPHKTPVGANCVACHSSETWKTDKIEHARTGFVLKGLHAKVECATCHRQAATRVALKFQRCADCHSDPHAGRFRQDCASCHNERGFGGAPFDHTAQTHFALTGAHTKLQCTACHKATGGAVTGRAGSLARSGRAVNFGGLNGECASCHRDVHTGEAGPNCVACHSSVTFRNVTYAHKSSPEFFGGNHAGLSCAKCHTFRGVAPPRPSADALFPLLDRMPRLMLASSRGFQPVPRSPARPGPAAPATGTSQNPDAVRWRFKATPTNCASCHRDPHLGQLGTTCERCHTVAAQKFAAVKFSHAAAGFQLTGKHQAVACANCHKAETGTFPAGTGTAVRYKSATGAGTACSVCHKDTHLGQLGKKCELCHNIAGFTIPYYTHLLRPEMSKGKHAPLECRACHKREEGMFPDGTGAAVRYVGFQEGCASCHSDVHKGSMGRECETCHSVQSFETISRGFHKSGNFPLEGQHLNVPCASCHINGEIKGTPRTCFDCHWQRRQDDRYRLRLGKDCETCHRPVSWTATRWSHSAATGVPLNPTHRILGCDSCHKQLEFRKGIAVDCASCHVRDFERASQPNHVSAGFPMACEACHRPSDPDWNQARFDHNASFPLVGQHALAQCAQCHKNNIYKGTARECIGCHQADFNNAKQPDHVLAGFATSCDSCHRVSDPDWHRASLNHDQYFRLDGRHRLIQCIACHKTTYRGTPRDCVACHQADYNRTSAPNHAAAGFPTDCAACHRSSDADWHAANFNHDMFFRLEGVHRSAACARCHVNGTYKGTPSACVGCHQADYNRTASPNHAAAGFPTDCAACHRASDPNWHAANFNHDAYYRLEGTHRTLDCARCHSGGNYRGTPTACASCHQAQYNSTTNPNHAAAGFGTNCDACHRASDSSWSQGRFNHPFPLSGPHNVDCSRCHLDRSNYRVFSCTVCHERTTTDSHHRQVNGYRYDSAACYACHPNGRH